MRPSRPSGRSCRSGRRDHRPAGYQCLDGALACTTTRPRTCSCPSRRRTTRRSCGLGTDALADLRRAAPVRALPGPGRDRPRRHGRRARARDVRPGPRPGAEGSARDAAPRRCRRRPPVRRGGADRRPAPASRDRAGARAGRSRRPPALFHHEAGQGPHAGGAAGRAVRIRRPTCRGSWRSSSRSARRWPTPTPGG